METFKYWITTGTNKNYIPYYHIYKHQKQGTRSTIHTAAKFKHTANTNQWEQRNVNSPHASHPCRRSCRLTTASRVLINWCVNCSKQRHAQCSTKHSRIIKVRSRTGLTTRRPPIDSKKKQSCWACHHALNRVQLLFRQKTLNMITSSILLFDSLLRQARNDETN